MDRADHSTGGALGTHHGNPLGHQLAEDQHKKCHEQGNKEGDGAAQNRQGRAGQLRPELSDRFPFPASPFLPAR